MDNRKESEYIKLFYVFLIYVFILCQNNKTEKILELYLLELKKKWMFGKNFNSKNRNWMWEIVKYVPERGIISEERVGRRQEAVVRQYSQIVINVYSMCSYIYSESLVKQVDLQMFQEFV